VGKSSLMNMLARSKVSIVDPTPGVTRDRVTAIIHLDAPDKKGPPIIAELVDTGGFGAYVAEGERYDDVGEDLTRLAGDIEYQISQATQGADLILLAIDAQAGVTALDEEIARRLREQTLGKQERSKASARTDGQPDAKAEGKSDGKPAGRAKDRRKAAEKNPDEKTRAVSARVQVIATKTDGQRWEPHALEASALGMGEPWFVSAKNNYMRREFLDFLYMSLSDIQEDQRKKGESEGHATDPKDARPVLKLAIIGKRNAGKSTLVNTLAGEPRMIVSEIAGTTRDSVDVRFEYDGKVLVAIDTAGLRRKRAFANQIEWFAYDRLQLSVDRADVVMVLIDATVKISQVDEQVAMLAQKAFKPAIIVVNKWDLADGQRGPDGKIVTTQRYEDYIRRELQGLWYAPIAFMSGESGMNVRETVDLAFDLHRQASERVTTGKLNRLVAKILETRGPTDKVGSQAKVYFVAQTGTNPPTISMVVNKIHLFTPNYQRFLLNRFREELPFTEIPIRLNVKPRSQKAPPATAIASAGVRMQLNVDDLDETPMTAEEFFAEFENDDAPNAPIEAGEGFEDAAIEDGGEEVDETPATGRSTKSNAEADDDKKPGRKKTESKKAQSKKTETKKTGTPKAEGKKAGEKAAKPAGKKSGTAAKAAAPVTAEAADTDDDDFDDEIDADAYFAEMEAQGIGEDIDDDDDDSEKE
jgi:GTP-binding protein